MMPYMNEMRVCIRSIAKERVEECGAFDASIKRPHRFLDILSSSSSKNATFCVKKTFLTFNTIHIIPSFQFAPKQF